MSLDFYDDGNGCRPTVKITDTGSMSTYQKLCYVLEKIEEIIDFVNSFEDIVDAKEDSVNITNNRKLSEEGNFTGTWFGEQFINIVTNIDSNESKIDYLTNQFADGQTGFVIDGGFFEETGIARNFNGGIF